jgi:hypothetical protein
MTSHFMQLDVQTRLAEVVSLPKIL